MPPVVAAIGVGNLFLGGAAVAGAVISSRAAKRGSQANASAISEANTTMAEAQVRAAELIAQGQAEAAGAAIEGAKISAKAVLDAAQLSVDAQERFFAIADKKLEPFREQGLIAQDELASMLGIPNAEGKLVPYNTEKLRQTPGYEFVFNEGQRAVERSAAGQKLSGSQLKAQTQYGQNYGDQFFGRQVGYLQNLQGTGANAAGSLAQAATGTGRGVGAAYSNQGAQLSNIYGTQGAALADIAASGASAQASLISDLAGNQGNLALAAGRNRASLYSNRANIYGNALGNIAYGLGRYGNFGSQDSSVPYYLNSNTQPSTSGTPFYLNQNSAGVPLSLR